MHVTYRASDGMQQRHGVALASQTTCIVTQYLHLHQIMMSIEKVTLCRAKEF